jgi:hypothetical protein
MCPSMAAVSITSVLIGQMHINRGTAVILTLVLLYISINKLYN